VQLVASPFDSRAYIHSHVSGGSGASQSVTGNSSEVRANGALAHSHVYESAPQLGVTVDETPASMPQAASQATVEQPVAPTSAERTAATMRVVRMGWIVAVARSMGLPPERSRPHRRA
jgi:hypothetical protein